MNVLLDGWSALARAIVYQACADYQRKTKQGHYNHLQEIERFFRSNYGNMLCYGHNDRILQALQDGTANKITSVHETWVINVEDDKMSEDTCVVCGAIIPEGRQVCPMCEHIERLTRLEEKAARKAAENEEYDAMFADEYLLFDDDDIFGRGNYGVIGGHKV